MKKLSFAVMTAMALQTFGANAAETDTVANRDIATAVNGIIGSEAVERVTPMPYEGLYEVVLDNKEIIYTNQNVDFILNGDVIDGKTLENVTQKRAKILSKIDIESLQLDQAVKLVKGDGSRFLVTFEDPNCGYCKRLANDLAKMDNITIYTFLYPVLGRNSDQKARHIMCADDIAKTWVDWMINGQTPAKKNCDAENVIDKNIELGRQLRISGTPLMVLSSGERIPGYVSPEKLDAAINEAAKTASK